MQRDLSAVDDSLYINVLALCTACVDALGTK